MTICDDILDRLAHADPLDERRRDWLFGLGVPATALDLPDPLRVASVIPDAAGRFAFPDECDGGEAVPAIVVALYAPDGTPDDLAAWFPRSGAVRTWLGRVSYVGDAFGPRLDEHAALPVHASVLDWLRADREGIAIVDPAISGNQLHDAGPFVAMGGVEHARVLTQQLSVPRPRILVAQVEPSNTSEAA